MLVIFKAVSISALMALLALLAGTVIGIIFGVGSRVSSGWINRPIRCLITMCYDIPPLPILFLLYTGTATLEEELKSVGMWVIFRESYSIFVIAMSLVIGVQIARQVQFLPNRTASINTDTQQSGTRSPLKLVVCNAQTALKLVVCNAQTALKLSALASMVSVHELSLVSSRLYNQTGELWYFLVVATIYLGLDRVLSVLGSRNENQSY